MSFADDLNRFTVTVQSQIELPQYVDIVHESIQTGHPIAGTLGQPVGQYGPGYHPGRVGSYLRGSWQKSYPSKTEGLVSTNTVYAKPIEDGVGPHGPLTLRSSVGQFHAVKQTIAAWPRIVAEVAKRNG